MNYRPAEFIILTGTNNTGKSTFLKKLAEGNKRNLVLPANALDPAWADYPKITPHFTWENDPDHYSETRKIKVWQIPELHSFTGLRVLDISNAKSHKDKSGIFQTICDTKKGMIQGALHVDDYKNWIFTKGSLPYHVRELFNDRRHRQLDIFMASHSFQDINSDLVQFNPKLIIFWTTLPINETVQKKIANNDQLQETISRVNKINEKQPNSPHYAEMFTIQSR